MPILQGRMRGYRWIVGSSDHGCWLGSYELEERKVFEGWVNPGSVVFDIGAHVGYYTLLASILVGAEGDVHAFEPLPQNLPFLYRHIEINRLKNVLVHEVAVSDRDGEAYFKVGSSRSTGQVSNSGEVEVQLISLDSRVKAGELPVPGYIKIDVEGAELAVLAGARALLTDHKPTLFLETHSAELHASCIELLSGIGYTLQPVVGDRDTGTGDLLAFVE
jgi:FkbM family methyltransferase